MDDQEFEKQYTKAVERGKERTDRRALSTRYEKARRRVVIEVNDETAFAFPVEIGQGLAGASDEDLSEINISPAGYGLHWPSLDADLLVESLLVELFGSKN